MRRERILKNIIENEKEEDFFFIKVLKDEDEKDTLRFIFEHIDGKRLMISLNKDKHITEIVYLKKEAALNNCTFFHFESMVKDEVVLELIDACELFWEKLKKAFNLRLRILLL